MYVIKKNNYTFVIMLRLLPYDPTPDKRKKMDGWMVGLIN